MSWILDHLNLVIVGVLVIGSFLKSRFDSLKQDEQETEESPDFDTHQDSQRQGPPLMPYVPPPVERTPSPVLVQRSAQQPNVFAATRSQSGALSASSAEAASILQKQLDIQERLRVIREALPRSSGSRTPSQPMTNRKPVAIAVGGVPSTIRARLRNPAELRRAFVLREILDRPAGLR